MSTRWSLVCGALCAPALMAGPTATRVAAASSPTPGPNQDQLFGAHPLHEGQTTLPGGHFNFAMVPGATVSDGVVIENFSDHPLDFHIYSADLLSAAGGGLAPAQPTDVMHEGGAWIVMSTPAMTIPAHSQATDNFTVTLPSTIQPGEHLGAIVAAAIVGKSAQGSSIEARTALITVITVPGTAKPSGNLTALSRSTSAQQQLGFDITLANTGNLTLTYTGTVSLMDSEGHVVASLPLTPSDAYVVPAGHVALAALSREPVPQSGDYSAEATVTILANGKPVATLTSQLLRLHFASSNSPVVWLAGGIGGLATLIAAWFIVGRVRRRRVARAVV